MIDSSEQIESLLLLIVLSLASAPDDVTLQINRDVVPLIAAVAVAKSDLGRIIGKEGRMARSIRTIVRGGALKLKHPANIIDISSSTVNRIGQG